MLQFGHHIVSILSASCGSDARWVCLLYCALPTDQTSTSKGRADSLIHVTVWSASCGWDARWVWSLAVQFATHQTSTSQGRADRLLGLAKATPKEWLRHHQNPNLNWYLHFISALNHTIFGSYVTQLWGKASKEKWGWDKYIWGLRLLELAKATPKNGCGITRIQFHKLSYCLIAKNSTHHISPSLIQFIFPRHVCL